MKRCSILIFSISIIILIVLAFSLKSFNRNHNNTKKITNDNEFQTFFAEWPSPDKKYKIIAFNSCLNVDDLLLFNYEDMSSTHFSIEGYEPWCIDIKWAPNGKRFIADVGVNNMDSDCIVYSIKDGKVTSEAVLKWQRQCMPKGLFHREYEYVKWLDNNRITFDRIEWGSNGGYGGVEIEDRCIYLSNENKFMLIKQNDSINTSAQAFLPYQPGDLYSDLESDLPKVSANLMLFAKDHHFECHKDGTIILKKKLTQDEYKELLEIFSNWINKSKEVKNALKSLYQSSQALNNN